MKQYEGYTLVKETMTVTRYHLVKGEGKQAIKDVKEASEKTQYLQSCDELDWDGKITYEIEPLKENWETDLKLHRTARHIEERLSEESEKKPLTKKRRKGRIKKNDLDVNDLIDEMEKGDE